MKKILAFFTACCIMLCGCKNSDPQSDDIPDALPVMVTTSPENGEPSPYPVTVNDTVIRSSPQKTVCLSPYLTEILFEMGYGETLVGRGSYCDYPENASEVVDVGKPTKPDLAKIIELKPDILLTATAIPTKDIYRLEDAGITTVYIPNPDSIDKFNKIYCAVGLIYEGLFDGENVGNAAFSDIYDAFNSVEKSEERFIYITEGLSVAGGDTFESSVLSLFGKNTAEEGKEYSFNKEFLYDLQPEYIFVNNIYTIEDLLADEVLGRLTAIQNGAVTFIDNTYFERPSGRITELIDSLKSGIGQ